MSTASTNTPSTAATAFRRIDVRRFKDLRSIGPLIILPVLVIVFTSLNSRFFTSRTC